MARLSFGRRSLIVFFLALAVRGVLFAHSADDPEVFLQPDSKMYTSLAEGLIEQGSFRYSHSSAFPDVERMPGYPLMLAAVFLTFGYGLAKVAFIQILMDALICVFVYRLAESVWKGTGLLGGFLAAFNIGMISYAHFILNDSLFLFVFLLIILLLMKFLRKPEWGTSTLLGIGIAVAAMVRPIIIYLPLVILPFCLGVFLLNSSRVSGKPLWNILLLGFVFLLGLFPWSMRNYTHYERWSLTAQSGEHLLQYIVPFTWQYSKEIPFIDGMKGANLQFSEKMNTERIDVDKLNPFEKSDLQVAFAVDILKAEPVTAIMKAWAFGIIKNLFSPAIVDLSYLLRIDRPHFFYTEGTTTLERAWNFVTGMKGWFGWAVVANIIILVFARVIQVWGLIQMMRSKPWEAGFFVLIIAYFLLISGPVGYAKYRLPFEPILIVLLAIGVKDLWERWKQKRLRLEV